MKKHLTLVQRYQIQTYLQCGKSIQCIADSLQVNKTTIYRELKRNGSASGTYVADEAEVKSRKRKQRYRCLRKFNDEMKAFIEDKIRNHQWSPEQIVGYCRKHGIDMVSHERIYQYIRQDKKNGGNLYKFCRHKLKHRKRSLQGKRVIIANKVSIDQRPDIINNKQRFGDWEIDTIVGEKNRGAIVTIVERTTGLLFMQKLEHGKNAKELAQVVVNMLQPYKHLVHSITSDNGTEFAEHQYIAKQLQAAFYFAHPYAAWQRPINEYTNKLIREYIPKATNFNHITPSYIKFVQHQINNRPRKKLNYEKPIEIFTNFA